MLLSDVLELLRQGEGAEMEFKRDDVRAESLAKVIVSFANKEGGYILLGVEDDGAIAGIHREKLQAWIMDSVVGIYVHPHINNLNYEEIATEDGKIAVLTVPKGAATPYFLKRNKRLDIYIRRGDTCQLADRDEQVRLLASGGLVSVEKLTVHGSTVDELDDRRCQEYFAKIAGKDKRPDWHDFLINRDFLIDKKGSFPCCSYFAYALFAKNPQRRLPQSGVRVTVYPGNEKDDSASFDESLNMPLVEFRGDRPGNEPIEMALHDKAIDVLQPFISKERLDKTTRKRHWDYPLEVLRELLVNAFMHRDWTKQDYVRVVAYANRLEVVSPGALPNGMTVEKIKRGARSQRNPISVEIFRNYGYLEAQGMGIRYKVIPLTVKHTGREPEFEATEDYFKVTIWKKQPDDAGVSGSQ